MSEAQTRARPIDRVLKAISSRGIHPFACLRDVLPRPSGLTKPADPQSDPRTARTGRRDS